MLVELIDVWHGCLYLSMVNIIDTDNVNIDVYVYYAWCLM